MSRRELRRVEVLARVASEELRLVDVGKMLGLSYRQAKRLWQRYREEGAEGLKHRSAGRESNRAKPKKFRERVLRLVRKKYSGEVDERFGPTLAAEHLESEDSLEVNPETLRRWMLEEGLWSRARKRRKHRRRREPQAHFGEWVQLDGRLQKQLRRGEAAGDAVWTDARAAGDPDHRGEFTPGQRAGGAQPWHTPGPAGEEVAAEKHRDLGGGQRVFEEQVSGGAQRAVRPCSRLATGLSPPSAQPVGTGRGVPVRERTGDRQ